jgi:nitroreductase
MTPKITETIRSRRSVRTYNGQPLDDATARKITDFIATLRAPFGAGCRVELVRTAANTSASTSTSATSPATTSASTAEPVRLGTYGAIRGATDYLALIVRPDGPLAQEGAAYVFEQAVLYCTGLGLGTCWLAGFFDRGGFKKRLALQPGEQLRSVTPVGRAAEKPHRSISTLLTGGKPTTRKPFSETFFRGAFGVPLNEEAAGVWAHPLEMVRRAPSANNKQTWRVVLESAAGNKTGKERARDQHAGNVLHFYKVPSKGYEALDAGIALCHFEQTCRESGWEGGYEILPSSQVPQPPHDTKAVYVASWISAK